METVQRLSFLHRPCILAGMNAFCPLRSAAAGLMLSLALLTGCSTDNVDWESRMGSYTYADAVKQYGQPTQVEALTAGGRTAYWVLPDAANYSFKFQLPDFQGNQVADVGSPPTAMPAGGRNLGTLGKPVLKLTFSPEDKLTAAARTKVGAE